MIDEELYQFASDELNSDRRIPTLWDRACALARDDHDEARFLYKNLRVEELLEKQANGEPLPLGAIGRKKPATAPTSNDESNESVPGLANNVSLDMDAFEAKPPSAADTSTEVEASAVVDESLSLADESVDRFDTDAAIDTVDDATPAKIELDPLVFPSRPLENTEDALPSLDPEISSLAEQASQRVHEKNAGTADRPLMDQTIDAHEAADEALNDDFDIGAVADIDATSMSDKDDELAFLDNSIEENRETIIDQQREVLHQKDALSEDLERQADTWLPKDAATTTAVTAAAGSAAAGLGAAALARTDKNDAEPIQQPALDNHSNRNNDQIPVLANAQVDEQALESVNATAQERANGPGRIDEILNPEKSISDTDLLSGPGKLYRVFSRGANDNTAVRKGWSWTAMIVTFPWLLVKRMLGTALVYGLLWITLLVGLVVTGIHWLDTPPALANTVAVWPLAFAALAVIGLLLIPLVMANRWHAHSLVRRGYEEIATVRAPNKTRAVDRIIQLAA